MQVFSGGQTGEWALVQEEQMGPPSHPCHIVCFYVLTVMHSLTWIVCIV